VRARRLFPLPGFTEESAMKRVFSMLLMLCLVVGLAACGATIYNVNMKNGTTYQAKGEPEYDKKSGTYKFCDPKGKEVMVNKDDVQVIQQAN
jgi:major membrane immunogen (membrane-anchored lipoprotein)